MGVGEAWDGGGGAAQSSVVLSKQKTAPGLTAGEARVNGMGTVPLFTCALVSFFQLHYWEGL